MNRLLIGMFGGAVLMSVTASEVSANDTVLEFRTMVGVSGAFLGPAGNPIRGVNGGGLPWVLDKAKGELSADGELEVKVKGLIIPEPDRGFNPVPFFRALVSCLTENEFGEVVVSNILSDNGAEVMIGNPENGDAKIETEIDLPDPCIAPIIFVTSPTGAWFSVTGVESAAD